MTKFIKLLGKPILESQLYFPIVRFSQNRVSPWVRCPSKITNNSRKVTSSDWGQKNHPIETEWGSLLKAACCSCWWRTLCRALSPQVRCQVKKTNGRRQKKSHHFRPSQYPTEMSRGKLVSWSLFRESPHLLALASLV